MVEEQNEIIYSFLPHDLIDDINIENENTDAESPLEDPVQESKAKSFQKDFNNFSLGRFAQDAFDCSSLYKAFPLCCPIKQYIERNPINNQSIYHQFLSRLNTSLSNTIMSYSGSQYLQKMLSFMSNEDISELLQTVSRDLTDIMCNCYGNYFIQKIIKNANFHQRIFILTMIQNDFIQIAKNPSGTHCLQTFIDGITTKEEERLIKKSVKTHLLDLSFNPSGTHIVQKLLTNISQVNRNYIVKFILSNFFLLCKNLNGATVIKKFIAETSNTKISSLIISMLEVNFLEMCKDQYANYVIQFALEIYGYNQCKNIVNNILNNIVSLGQEKYSSNVIDKVTIQIKHNNMGQFEQLIRYVLLTKANFNRLNNSKYGQYVLINIIKMLSPECKNIIKAVLINDIEFCETIKCSKVFNFLM